VLVSRDDYFLMADFGSYVDTQSAVSTEYQHPEVWTRKAILNLARIGAFSSDRAVTEYSREIWHLGPA
jgi:starch phosphorylase